MAVREVPFTELLSHIVDNRGRTCPTSNSGMPLIATNCVRNDLLYPAYDKVRYVSKDTYANWFRGHPEPGDLIFVCKGSPGRVCLTPDPVGFCIAQDMVAVRADPTKVYPRFLFAALRSDIVQQRIANMHVGTLIPHFKKGDFDKLLVPLPDYGTQTGIGDLYFTLSAMIDLNRRMNATLEAMSRAIFKSWFVDFDPVRQKAAGKQPVGMDAQTAAMFPDSFEESEIGEVPKGWGGESIYEAADVIYGATFASTMFNGSGEGIPLIRIRDLLTESPDVFTPEKHPKGYLVQAGDIIVGMDGEFRAYVWGGLPGWLNQRVCVFKPKPPFCPAFVREAIVEPLRQVEVTETATTVIHLGKGDIDRFRFMSPCVALVAAFGQACQPLYDAIVANRRQSRTLAALRDTLLPKLLSGEIRVPEAEEALA